MTKYKLVVHNMSVNGFKDDVVFTDKAYAHISEIMDMFAMQYDYVCEFHITRYKED